MALSKISGLFGVEDCQIAPLTSDVKESAVAYGTVLDVPGIKSLKFDLNVTSKENKGDEVILDTEDNIEYADISWENAELSLDVLAAINGGDVTNTGTDTSEKNVYMYAGNSPTGYFKLFAKPKRGYTDAGIKDVLLEVFKVKGTLSFSFVGEDYATCSFKGKGIRTKGTVDTKAQALYRLSYGAATLAIA